MMMDTERLLSRITVDPLFCHPPPKMEIRQADHS